MSCFYKKSNDDDDDDMFVCQHDNSWTVW